MRDPDVVKAVDVDRAEADLAAGYAVEVALEHGGGQVGGVTGVGGQPGAVRQVTDRVEVAHDPLVGQHSGEADGAVDPDGRQGVRQGRGADELQGGVHAIGNDLANLAGDGAIVDQRVVDTVRGKVLGALRVAGGGQDGGAHVLGQGGGSQA